MSCTLQNLTPCTGTPFSSCPESVFLQSERPCGDQRPQQSVALTELAPFLGLWAQLDCWRPGLQALCRRRSVHWTRKFTCQTLVLPPVDHSINQWLSGKQRDASRMGLRRLHHTTYRNEKQVQNDHKFISLTEKNLMSSSSQDPTSAGKPVAVFSSRNRLNQDTFSDRDEISLRHLQFFGVVNFSSDSLTRQVLRNLFLMELEIICLLKGDLNLWNRNTKWNLLTLAHDKLRSG